MNSLAIAGSLFIPVGIAGLIILLVLSVYFKDKLATKFITPISDKNMFTKLSPRFYVISLFVLCLVIGIMLAGVGNKDIILSTPASQTDKEVSSKNLFGNVENFRSDSGTTTYKSIGYGPVIDKIKVSNWLNGKASQSNLNTSSETAWPDGNGQMIKIPKEQFKSLYGYIPPSFSYYPKGQNSNDYSPKNNESGRDNCMKACTLTNCLAVQTEVPENCSQKVQSNGENSCGSNAEFSCTLFYDNIKNADDAYWTINNYSQEHDIPKGCFEITDSSCLGKKYYEDSKVPITLPNNTVKPSQNKVTFCNEAITKTNTAGYGIVSGGCSCSGPVGGDGCVDPNCCVMRPLLTTEYVQHNYPYYSLPINVTKAAGAVSGDSSMLVPTVNYTNGVSSPCGIVGTGASAHLVSCTGTTACASSSDLSSCWKVNTNLCSGDPFTESTGATALSNYKTNYAANDGKNFDDLYPSCYYRQKLTVVEPIQFNCDPALVTRGCWGSPSILYTSSLTASGGFAACSDSTVIPNSERCQNTGSSELAKCNGFPFSCGNNDGSNTLWVKKT